ncbi:MAG TPA: DinB family protein [Candidatus Dormibacteraeota bacterium]|nr:DinB family protein [Candidatus Dormibacteraeota bacterium]
MAPADLLKPLEGQREETLRLLDTLVDSDLDVVVRGDGRTVRQLLYHLIDREHEINVGIRQALGGDISPVRLVERPPGPPDLPGGWDLTRIRRELAEARESLRQTFLAMREEDLDLPIRWPGWPARTIRTAIPYMLEHEDSHLDELRSALRRQRAS